MPSVTSQICARCQYGYPESSMTLCPETQQYYCKDCGFMCKKCEVFIEGSRGWMVGGDRWCKNCTVEYSTSCSYCDKRWASDSPAVPIVYDFRFGALCLSCRETHFWLCERDVRLVYTGENCASCGMDSLGKKPRCVCGCGTESSPVHQYSCKPVLVFHGKSKQKIHMGFELETRIAGGRSESAIREAALFAMNRLQPPEIAQLKYDSSIGGGFEIVTQPHTYEAYQKADALWETLDILRKEYKARSWDTGTCGLHIHISRNAFTDGPHTHKFLTFIYSNPEMLMKFAGRKDTQYATFHDCWKVDKYERPEFDINDKLKKGKNTIRHSAVNTRNEHTIELRFLRGTMNPSGVRAGLGLAHAMVQYTRDLVDTGNRVFDNQWEFFDNWVMQRQSIYPELAERMPVIKDFDIDNVPSIDA